MKKITLLTFGILLLLVSCFFWSASSSDYVFVLALASVFGVSSIFLFILLLRYENNTIFKIFLILFTVIGFFVSFLSLSGFLSLLWES
jgi:hypothetical protein